MSNYNDPIGRMVQLYRCAEWFWVRDVEPLADVPDAYVAVVVGDDLDLDHPNDFRKGDQIVFMKREIKKTKGYDRPRLTIVSSGDSPVDM